MAHRDRRRLHADHVAVSAVVLVVAACSGLTPPAPPTGRAPNPTTVVASATLPASPSSGCAAVIDGLTSWWPAEDGADDVVGGNGGDAQGGVTYAVGKVGRAFSFNGADQWVRLPTSDSLNPDGSFSLDAWIRPDLDLPFGTVIIQKWGDLGAWAGQRAFALNIQPQSKVEFAISDRDRQDDSAFHVFDSPADSIAVGAWNHVAATYDHPTGRRTIYVDGVEVAVRTDQPIAITDGVADAGIGGAPRSPDGNVVGLFPGLIDEVAMYNRALTAAEVAAIHEAGEFGRCAT